jgi:hypothetical protein
MEHQRPVRLLVLGHQKKGSHKLKAEQDNEENPCDAVKDPDKHRFFLFRKTYIYCIFKKVVKEKGRPLAALLDTREALW